MLGEKERQREDLSSLVLVQTFNFVLFAFSAHICLRSPNLILIFSNPWDCYASCVLILHLYTVLVYWLILACTYDLFVFLSHGRNRTILGRTHKLLNLAPKCACKPNIFPGFHIYAHNTCTLEFLKLNLLNVFGEGNEWK